MTNIEIYSLGADPEATLEVTAALRDALSSRTLACRLCEFRTESGAIGDMLEELGQHGDDDHRDVFFGEISWDD